MGFGLEIGLETFYKFCFCEFDDLSVIDGNQWAVLWGGVKMYDSRTEEFIFFILRAKT